jgi:hypothetical protein
MSVHPPTRFALDTAQDMFKKLKRDEERLMETWDVYDSFNFVVTAHHLYVDWLKPASATPEQIQRKKQLSAEAKEVFRAVLDVSNGSKHWQMTNPDSLARQVIISVSTPAINDWFAYFEDKPMVYFTFSVYKLSMAELSDFVMKYFDWILNGDGKPFPAQLTADLNALKVGP